MERRNAKLTAMAIAATALTGTFAFATLGGMSILGLGAVHRPSGAAGVAAQIVAAAGPLPSEPAAVSAPADSTATPIVPILIGTPTGPDGTTSGVTPAGTRQSGAFGQQPVTPTVTTPSGNGPTVTVPATTPATVPPTTAATTPTTVRPAGVPADWPANKPIPPMPANCKQPQLEDNGVWNCQN